MKMARGALKVVVIGAGISGLFLSYYLLRDGHDVVVADASRGSVRTSEFNAGQLSTRPSFTDIFSPSGSVRVSQAEKRRNRDWFRIARRQTAERYEETGIPLSIRSLALYEKFFAKESAELDLREEVLDLHTTLPADRKGRAGRFLTPRELSELGYLGFEGGWLAEERSLHSGKLLGHLRSRVAGMGGRFIEGEARLHSAGRRISRAVVGGKELSAEAYVVAAGSWSREVCRPLGYDPMVIPARGLVLFCRTNRKRVIDLPSHYDDEGVTATQHDQDTLRFTSFFELVGYLPQFSRSSTAWLFKTATSHFSRPCALEVSQTGVGFRPSTPDQLPLVGRIPRCENGYVLAGATRKGMALAPVLGKLVIDSIFGPGGRPDPMLRALDPIRFERAGKASWSRPKF